MVHMMETNAISNLFWASANFLCSRNDNFDGLVQDCSNSVANTSYCSLALSHRFVPVMAMTCRKLHCSVPNCLESCIL